MNKSTKRLSECSEYKVLVLPHLGLLLNVFEQRLHSVRTRLSHRSERVFLQSRAMELPQLHGPHVSGEEGLPQLQGRDGVLFDIFTQMIRHRHFKLQQFKAFSF